MNRCILIITVLISSFLQVLGTPPIDADRICRHIEVLASDAFEGRDIATPGEEKAIRYIADQFEAIGLEPAVEGSYFQPVYLSKFNPVPPSTIQLQWQGTEDKLKHAYDFLLASRYRQKQVEIPSTELVYAGFGIHAPEIGWDDYKDVDISGKIVVVLGGIPSDYTDDDNLWKGDPAAEIYSKPFYKRNEAASRGALGIVTVHKQSKQGVYTWENLVNYVGVNDLSISKKPEEQQLKFSILLSRGSALELFTRAGYREFEFQDDALKTDFRPRPLGVKAGFSFSNQWEDIQTHNVAGLLPGTDLADEVMVYSAHWDHVGILPGAEGDSIRNGAVDNASGTAALIELARSMKAENKNRRSILFLATGAEEKGLLGSVWYNAHPLFPTGKTIANFNMDAHYPYGRGSHITAVVYGRSQLDKYLEEAAYRQGRTLVSNDAQNMAMDIFFRSDHFPFVEKGVPSEFAVGFGQAVGHDNDIYQQKMAAYAYKYHQPSDEYHEDFNCEGIADDAQLIMTAGLLIDREGAYPSWHEGQPFRKFQQDARKETDYFIDVTEVHTPLISTQGRTMDAKTTDIDSDGDIDIIITGEFSYNILLVNDGKGIFTDETIDRLALKRHDSEDIAIGDFDGDGSVDIVFVSEDDETNEYYLNNGNGIFSDQSQKLPVSGKSNAVLAMDVNADGHPDLIIGNDGINFCLINDGNGNWKEEASRIPDSQKTTQDLEAGDIDGDGDTDIICGNEDGNEVWINDGMGQFTDKTTEYLPSVSTAWETREADLADIDGDGDLDLFLANVNFRQNKDMQNRLFLNDGKGRFKDVTETHLPTEQMHTVDGDFVDLDGDGKLDLITANSFGHSFECYLNDGTGRFVNQTASILPASVRGDGIDVEAADFNGDGKTDLYLCNFRGSDMLLFGK